MNKLIPVDGFTTLNGSVTPSGGNKKHKIMVTNDFDFFWSNKISKKNVISEAHIAL